MSGRLTTAVQESLLLKTEPQALNELMTQWAKGDYENIPEILLLPGTVMDGAMGAYASGTGTIFLNADWLQNATRDQVLLVLTEELGHHLDAMLNQTDTPGDEGELLARLLADEKLSLDQMALIESDQDQGKVFTGGQIIQVEQAALAKVSVTVLANGKESDASPVVFGFQRNGDISGPLSVIYRLYGTANAGTDYKGATSGTVNFAAGSSSATLSLPVLADVVIDPGETMIAQISPSSAYAITPGQQTATATITAEGVEVSVKVGQFWGSSGEYSNPYAFAALKSDGSVVAWGDSFYGGTTPFGLSDVKQIYSGNGTFAALKSDGSVIAWGDSYSGGVSPSGLSGVTQIYSNGYAFAAIKEDGSVVAWGDSSYGGTAPQGLIGVIQIFSTSSAFAALKSDGSVVAWGDSYYGGISPSGLSGVTNIYSNVYAFAALRNDGSVVAWGDSWYGGAAAGLTGVTQIVSNGVDAFAALKSDGSVVAWGNRSFGGSAPTGLSDINQIFSNALGFAALKSDGSVVAWGDTYMGDYFGGQVPPGLTGVTQIFSTSSAFVALNNDGSVVAWGDSYYGGISPSGLSGVTQIYSNAYAFAALRNDGSVVAWGDSNYGGTAPAGLTGVTQIISNGDDAFAALRSDGSVVAWGDSSYGGSAPAWLTGVVGFANPLTDDSLLLETITYNTISKVGSVVFQKAIDSNRYSVAVDGFIKPITIQGNPIYEGIYPDWQTVSAATINGVNTVLWRNTASNRLHTWTTDANWRWLSSQGWIDPNSSEGYSLESQFQQDLNHDSIIGAPYTPITTVGSVMFQKAVGTNRYSVAVNDLIKPITIQGNPIYEGIYPNWQTISAANINGSNTVLWRNTAYDRLQTWTTDADWSWLSSQGWIDPNSSEGYKLEFQFKLDLNQDHIVGSPYTPITTVGSVVFQRAVGNNRYSVAVDGLTTPITIQGNPIFEGIYPEWQTISAATINGTNTVLWQNTTSNRLHTWTTDANWKWLSSQGSIDPNSNNGYTLESQFQQDLNHDTIIGSPCNAITTVGSVVFQKSIDSNRYSVSVDGLTKPITIQGNPIYEGIYPDWQTISAATINGVNTVLWRNTASNRLHTWTTDSNWRWLSSQGSIDPNSKDGYTLESQFKLDLNQDNIIGSPYNAITTVGSVVFQKSIGSNRYSVDVDGLINPITIQGNPIYDGIFPDWQTVSAATINGINTVLWQNTASNRLHTWTTDANWKWLSSQGWINPDSSEGFKLESQFKLDLNQDSWIGQPLSPI